MKEVVRNKSNRPPTISPGGRFEGGKHLENNSSYLSFLLFQTHFDAVDGYLDIHLSLLDVLGLALVLEGRDREEEEG